jgi:hypothetical protein
MVVTAAVKNYAHKQGLFIIEHFGENFNITATAANLRNGDFPVPSP